MQILSEAQLSATLDAAAALGPDAASACAAVRRAHEFCAPEIDAAAVLKAAEEARALAWTALHTGPWAAVAPPWRSVYACACYYAALAHASTAPPDSDAALRALDLGLMLGDTRFRPQLLRAAERLEARRGAADAATATAAPPPPPPQSPSVCRPLSGGARVPRLPRPSLAWFYNECLRPAAPAVLTGVIDGWPARSTRPWSDLAYLKRVAGHRTVPVEVGAHYLDDAFDERLMTLADFLEAHVEGGGGAAGGGATGGGGAYLAQHQLFTQLPQLRRDIAVPDYCSLSLEEDEEGGEGDAEEEAAAAAEGGAEAEAGGPAKRRRVARRGYPDGPAINAWLGPAGTLSPLHHDPDHNLLAQVVGSKYVRLYSPEQTERLYPRTDAVHRVSSQIVDPDAHDAARFPRFGGAPYADVVLNAGEVLYIPPRWWHFVEARETSFSVSFWWR